MIRRMSAVALALCAGCTTKSLSEYRTSEIQAEMRAAATSNGKTTVNVSLHDASSSLTYLQLTTDDKLEATFGDNTQPLHETSLLGAVGYSASFDGDAGESVFHVRFSRTRDDGAPDSSASLPTPFTLRALSWSTHSRAEAMTISWTSDFSVDAMQLTVTGPCIDQYDAVIGAVGTGQFVIPAGALAKRASDGDQQGLGECDATVSVSRSRAGSVDPAFHGGRFTGVQVRETRFRSTP